MESVTTNAQIFEYPLIMAFQGIQNLRKEEWKTVKFDDTINPDEQYSVSNLGRLVSIKNEKTKLFQPYEMNGYQYFRVKKNEPKKFKTLYLHKVVAQHFLEQGNGIFVIHLDYNKLNNQLDNLKWATKREKELHQWKNPVFIVAKEKSKRSNSKLTENNVRLLKKIINDPNRRTRLKIIAKRFGVTTMQLQRIKTGENWADIPSL